MQEKGTFQVEAQLAIMNIFNWINWFIFFCAGSINFALSGPVTDGMNKRGNLIRGKSVRYGATGKTFIAAGIRKREDKRNCGSISINNFPFKYYYVVPLLNSYELPNSFGYFPERLFSCITQKKHRVIGSLLFSGYLLLKNNESKLMKHLVPNELNRMGSALITTASICIDYRLQEALKTDINACHKRSSIKLGKLCAKNGGLYIKAAQHLASMDHLLPKPYINELSQLQDQAPVSQMRVVEQVFREELGKGLNEVFSDICDVPIGSASIGQVHLARLRSTGEQVALKIQHPNIKKDSEVDLNSFKLALKIIKQVLPAVNLDWIVDELRECLDSELNFKLEAENSKEAKNAFEMDPKFSKMVLIPKVYDNLTTERVLTMEFIPGFKINDTERMKAAGLDFKKVNILMYEVFMEMIFKHNFVHCDPHPGNILINNNDGEIKLVLLDHGIYKSIPSDVVTKFSRLFLAILDKDFESIANLAVELNISVEIIEDFRNLMQMMTDKLKNNNSNNKNNFYAKDQLKEEISKLIVSENKKRQASDALKSIPRELFFIIKILDLLRSNERNLKKDNQANVSGSQRLVIPESLMIITRYCLDQVEGPDPSKVNLIFTLAKLMITFIKLRTQN